MKRAYFWRLVCFHWIDKF